MNYRDFQPTETSRIRENIEWTHAYAYNARDTKSPRVLMIGDSICNQYQAGVREGIGTQANISFWISSKCVTDVDYFRELNYILEQRTYTTITFNNGLHSIDTDFNEWTAAYRKVIAFLQAKCPHCHLSLVFSTPLESTARNKVVELQNAFIAALGEELSLPVLDLYTIAMGEPDTARWNDGCHFCATAVSSLATAMTMHLLPYLPQGDKLTQEENPLGPDGALK